MSELPTICILAGGLGTRLGDAVAQLPKPLVDVAGEPFLFHQLRLLAAHDASEVVLCVGYRGEQIEQRVGSERFGVRITYSYDRPGLEGTLGAIRRASSLLPDRFLVLYGDAYLRLDYRAAVSTWLESGKLGLMTVYRNDGRWDTSNVLYRDGAVVAYDKHHPSPEMAWIDYGLGGLTEDALELVADDVRDLAVLQQRLVELDQLCGYEAHERFYEIGTPDSLEETSRFLASQRRSPTYER